MNPVNLKMAAAVGLVVAAGMLGSTPARAVIVFDGAAGIDPANNFMYVGDFDSGSATVSSPGPDTVSALTLGNQFVSTAVGTVLVSGAGAVLNATNTIVVGGQGIGSMRIENGGIANSIGGESPFCPGCNSTIIGNGGGANGTLVVTGAGSQYNVTDTLGNSAVFIVANGHVTPTYGTTGAPTSGSFSVLNAASANTLSTVIANSNLLDPTDLIGQSHSTGIVTVDGAGSVWKVAPMANGIPAFIGVGDRGTGTLNISAGGRVETTHMHVGRANGSVGSVLVTGNGSVLQMVGGNADIGGAGFSVGWQAGATGTVTVQDGGRIHIDGTGSGGPAGMSLGGLADAPGGTATMVVSGAGSLVEIIGDSAGELPSGFTVGVTGNANLSVLAGGRIQVTDNSPGGFGSFSVGGNVLQGSMGTAAGTGTMLVSGAGSEVDIRSAHGSFRVGQASGGTGTVNVEAGGRIKSASGMLAENVGSIGTMTIKGATSSVDLAGDSYGFGAFLVVGAAGTGTLNVVEGGTLSIHASPTVPFGGMAIGGTRTQAAGESGGTGTVNVGSGGRILVSGDSTTHIKLGVHQGGSGVMNVTGGGQVIIGRPLDPGAVGDESGFYVAPAIGATGVAVVQGNGSLIDAGGFIGVGVAADKLTYAGAGVLTVRDGGRVIADQIHIGSAGVLNGNGTVQGNVVSAGVIAPGNSPGTLTITGNLTSTGQIDIEVAGLADGQFDVLNVLGAVNLQGSTIRFVFSGGFLPRAGDTFDFLTGTPTAMPLSGVTYGYTGLRNGFDFTVNAQTGVFQALNDAAPVPEPGTWAMFGVGAGLLAFVRHSRRSVEQRAG